MVYHHGQQSSQILSICSSSIKVYYVFRVQLSLYCHIGGNEIASPSVLCCFLGVLSSNGRLSSLPINPMSFVRFYIDTFQWSWCALELVSLPPSPLLTCKLLPLTMQWYSVEICIYCVSISQNYCHSVCPGTAFSWGKFKGFPLPGWKQVRRSIGNKSTTSQRRRLPIFNIFGKTSKAVPIFLQPCRSKSATHFTCSYDVLRSLQVRQEEECAPSVDVSGSQHGCYVWEAGKDLCVRRAHS